VRFEWSWALAGLLLVPVLVLAYLLAMRRKRKFPVRYASLSLIREARPGRSRWRRHLPFALFVMTVASLVLAFARPEVTVSVARGQTTIVLAIDVSRSMCATDVEPNRLVVAQDAAKQFVEDQPEGTRLGIVAFAGSAQTVVAPTTDKERLRNAIDGLTTALGTGIGNAVMVSIDAVAEVNPSVAPSTVDLAGDADPDARGGGGYEPDIIVLLTDGANTRGIDPLVSAQQAADRRLRVYTIGFGTSTPLSLVCTPEQLGGEALQPGAPPGFGVPGGGLPTGAAPYLVIDEPTLEAVAETTGAEYFRAENAGQLLEVFRELPARVERQDEPREVSVVFAALAAVLVVAAVGLSLRWNRVP
jgi:Ca-activated chloride channel family protein